jgi:hypothetical protein
MGGAIAKKSVQFAVFRGQNKQPPAKLPSTPVIVFQGVQDKLVKSKGSMDI